MAEEVLKREKLRDSAIVCLILIAQAVLPIAMMLLRPEDNKFKSNIIAVCSQVCIYISFPLLLFSAFGLMMLSRVGTDIDADSITPLSHTGEQLQRLQYSQGSLALASCLQSAAGLFWILEARQHPNSFALILLTAASSALLGVLVIHVFGVMRVIERMKTKVGGEKLEFKQQPRCRSSSQLEMEESNVR